MFVIGLIVGLLIGATLGVIAFSLCVVAGNADAHLELEEWDDPQA